MLAGFGMIQTGHLYAVGAVAVTAVGTTDFTLIGAATNVVGTVFIATGVGTGTGTATPRNLVNNIAGLNNVSLSGVLEVNTGIV